MSDTQNDLPWVIQGEPGPSTLTKWENDAPIGFEPWCGTCGWHGAVQLLANHTDSEAWQLAGDEGLKHMRATGHVYPDEPDEMSAQDEHSEVIDRDGTNATASFLLNVHHAVVPSEDESYCETCRFAIGWVQPTSLGGDEYGHATAVSSSEVRAWIRKEGQG